MALISYKQFTIDERIINELNEHYKNRKIKDYFKQHGTLPSSGMVESFTIPSILMEEYKKYYYAEYYKSYADSFICVTTQYWFGPSSNSYSSITPYYEYCRHSTGDGELIYSGMCGTYYIEYSSSTPSNSAEWANNSKPSWAHSLDDVSADPSGRRGAYTIICDESGAGEEATLVLKNAHGKEVSLVIRP